MRVWRITKARFAATAFSGSGAAEFPGRWNSRGTRVVYASQSKSLAALEMLVALDRSELPPDLVCFSIDIPESVATEQLLERELPGDWNTHPPPEHLKERGSRWIERARSAVLSVPSALIPSERNFLLNPEHPEFVRLILGQAESFEYDQRLFDR